MAELAVATLPHNNPLYLQVSNAPGVALITTKLTGPENYGLWSRSFRLALLVKNKLCFVDGTCLKSSYTGDLAAQWERCNAVVLSWISSTVASELLTTIVYASNAKRLWDDFKESVNQAYATAVQEESQRLLSVVEIHMEPFTMLANRKPVFRGKKLLDNPCVHCGYRNHLSKDCYRIIGYLTYFNSKRKPDASNSSKSTGCFQHDSTGLKSSTNYVASVGQVHALTLTEEEYNHVQNLRHNSGHTNAGDEDDLKTDFRGNVSVTPNVCEHEWIIDSGNRDPIAGIGCSTILGDHTLKDILLGIYSEKVIGIGREDEGLYLLKDTINTVTTATIYNDNFTTLWHLRLGHPSLTAMQHIPSLTGNLSTLPCCHICPQAKQSRPSFPSSLHKSSVIFQLVHIDVWGRYRTPTYDKKQYFMTIVDDHKWGGGKKHRHILNIARALRFQASIPISYWGHCVKATVYLINKLPTTGLQGKSSHELLYGTPPHLDHLRVFGCLYFTSVLPKSNKFSPREKKGVFMGYAETQKGYRVFDLEMHSFHISRDVTFVEHEFSFQSDSSPMALHDLLEPLFTPLSQTSIPTLFDTSLGVQVECAEEVSTPPCTATDVSPPSAIPPPSAEHTTSTPDMEIVAPSTTRPNRSVRPLIWHQDYVVSNPQKQVHSTCLYSIGDYVVYSKLSCSYKSFLTGLSNSSEPTTFKESSSSKKWVAATKDEIAALEQNNTWKMVDIPHGKKAIGSKWVYKIKLQANGEVERYKARLVAKGYNQHEGLDYNETFSLAVFWTARGDKRRQGPASPRGEASGEAIAFLNQGAN
ncbi:uncharacterized protein LOC125811005 [Solanum verrucosum]|uniref:uncharacterized protein LOC125811005 n=1 Tax=Solanum verrucosum TaxID=315347 RepID=UPI0020D0B383|nr:uncharacterized protein LOC125811005 [Solanum verrucosum]